MVQVNPGETFTIRAEDGTLQCIQGKRMLEHADKHLLALWKNLCSNLYKNVICILEIPRSTYEREAADMTAH